MPSPTDNDYHLVKLAVQRVILSAPISQSRLARLCGVTRQSLNGWLNGTALPKLPAFLRLRRAARSWMDFRLDYLDLPEGWALAPGQVLPQGWRWDGDCRREALHVSRLSGEIADAVILSESPRDKALELYPWLNALMLDDGPEPTALVVSGGDSAIADGSERFRDYVTNTAFDLSLTRGMVETLLNIDYDSVLGYDGVNHGRSIRGLERRGLVEYESVKVTDERLSKVGQKVYHSRYVLTEAGRLLVPLLKLAGFESPSKVFQEFLETGPYEKIEESFPTLRD